jgi:hypothetical protein
VGKLQGQDVFEKMALETVLTSRLYVYYAASSYLRASITYADRYGIHGAVSPLQKELKAVEAELMQIALARLNVGETIHA